MRIAARTTIVSFLLATGLLFAPRVAHANEPAAPAPAEAETGINAVLASIDTQFGAWFVGPLAKVLFFDVIFWDNTADPQTLLGTTLDDGAQIIAYDAEKGFQLKRSETVRSKDFVMAVDDGTERAFGPVKVKIATKDGALVGQTQPGSFDISSYASAPFARWAGPAIQTVSGEPVVESAVVVQGATPFPIVGTVGDDGTFSIVPTMVAIPAGTLQPAQGAVVQMKDAAWVVDAVLGNNQFSVSPEAPVYDATIKPVNKQQLKLPFIVLWLVLGASFFTLRMGFINVRAFRHAIDVTAGKYDNPDDPGEISHFQALSSALSATVGLGNIAGVALAVSIGGPGALFWMIIAGFLGMTSKFTECTLGQIYRHVDENGVVSGGPMRYLAAGLEQKGFGGLGKVLSVMFALMCIGGSFGGGNMFQANQACTALSERFPGLQGNEWIFGLVLAFMVGLVIIGGIKRIGAAASYLVPAMCLIYLFFGLIILIVRYDQIPTAVGAIFGGAFSMTAGFGGMMGVLITGFQRAAFSNEAGVGSAAIAHSAAATSEPVREGIVALLGPFIDTLVVCTMTGLIVVVTGAYQQDTGDGVLMTSAAFGSVFSWFPWVLSLAVLLFAFSTMISWSYYGERCWTMLFGPKSSMAYRLVFLVFVFFGSVFKLGNVLDFSDLMILGMAFPNILGVVWLSGQVRERLDDYWSRFRAGEMKAYK